MIFDNFTATEGKSRDGQLVLTELDTIAEKVLKYIGGLFLMGVGGTVAYVLLSGNGPRPVDLPVGAHIMGWCVIALFLVVVGLVPLCWGFQVAFTRQQFVIDWREGLLRNYVVVPGVSVCKHRYPLSSFETVVLRNWRGGVFVKRSHWVVLFAGQERRINLVAFEDRQKGQMFAAQIASQANLPLLDEFKRPLTAG